MKSFFLNVKSETKNKSNLKQSSFFFLTQRMTTVCIEQTVCTKKRRNV